MKGRIITFNECSISETHIEGLDKFGEFVKMPLTDIDSIVDWRGD